MQKKENGEIRFSPTDLSLYFESRFASWMDHYQELFKNNGVLGKIHRNPPDDLLDLLSKEGKKHEKSILKSHPHLQEKNVIEISGNNQKEKIEKTTHAMKEGAEVIYQAALASNTFLGHADLLWKKEGKSSLGDYYYIPYDIKIATVAKPTAILQLLTYCDLLQEQQGRLPEEIGIITKNKNLQTYRVTNLFYYYLFFKKDFLKFHASFSPEHQPLPEKTKEHRDWSIYAKKVLHKNDDISLTANIRMNHVKILKQKGLETLTQLSKYKGDTIKEIPHETLKTLKRQAQLQVDSRDKKSPLYEVLPHKDRMGLAMIPNPTEKDIFFDMEGYPLIGENGLEYLYGFSDRKRNYQTIWAYHPNEENKAFQLFVELLHKTWSSYKEMKVYHYGHYEPSTLKRLMGRYGICEEMVDDLLRAEVFVDLYQVLKQALLVGTYNYGLKSIECLYYPERQTEVSSGSESAVEFSRWLDIGGHPNESEFLKRIEDYNKDDCLSTLDLEEFLRKIKNDKSITYIPFQLDDEKKKGKSLKPLRAECSEQAKYLLDSMDPEQRGLPFENADISSYVCEQLAHCLGFINREEKPDWWNYFSKQDLSYEDLYADSEALVNVRIISSNGKEFKCHFDVEQDSKFHKGSKVRIMENQNPNENLKVENIDYVKGEIVLSGNCTAIGMSSFTLVSEIVYFNKDMVLKALLNHAKNYNKEAQYFGLKKCVHDILTKSTPDIKNRHKNEKLIREDDIISELTDLVLNMNQTALCIQGPPGSGKTYTASRIIHAVINENKRVVISSNSHKAINLLAQEVAKLNSNCSIVKVSPEKQSKEDKEQFTGTQIEVKTTSTHPESLKNYDLIISTVYYLSKFQNEADYLFVDEATQVALPNLLAMTNCADNVVLLGDQMQLEQPIKASHPGESGNSILLYLTNGQKTLPPHFGVFLNKTYRMHPAICAFISSEFYEGRLNSIPETSKQKILWADYRQSGLLFIPIEHEGNTQASKEEVECIAKLVNKALMSEWMDKEGNRKPITWDDILIVAPYNHQVALLKDQLPEARVGTVDLFQGQEAALVITSMCSSSLDDAPRGASFLLNANRMNVAISRAKALSIVIGSPKLAQGQGCSIESMKLISTYCHLAMEYES